MASPPLARLELLRRLLERYERSRSFGQLAPWRRDVIVRIDDAEFPEAFASEGRELLADLRAAAEALAQAGAARVVRHRGYAAGVPHELRLGPGELEAAYRLAAAEGFEPLAEALAALRAHLGRLRAQPMPEWMERLLERLDQGAAAADLATLGMRRDRFKSAWPDVLDSLTAAVALALAGVSGWERVVSERLFGDSKRLGALRPLVVDILLRADPRWEGIAREEATDLLESYGLRRKPGLLRCAGRGEMKVAGTLYRLEDFTPTAHLPEAWVDAWIDALSTAPTSCITTIENEYPFLAYVEERSGPLGLTERREVAVYTGGFPAPVLVDALAEIARRSPATTFRHWGDADLGGLRIWWLLRSRLDRPIDLFRTRAEWFEEAVRHGGTALTGAERFGLGRLRDQLIGSPAGAASDVAEAVRLVDALLRAGRKVEQERYA
jgi:hypothetical protein